MQKIRWLKWNGQDIFFWANWEATTKIEDPGSPTGFRDFNIVFKNWDEIKGADKISLPKLYKDAFPEFTAEVKWQTKLNTSLLEEFLPWTTLKFAITDDDVFMEHESNIDAQGHEYENIIWTQTEKEVKKEEEKIPAFDLEKFKAELKAELKEEIRREIMEELKAWNKIKDDCEISEFHNLIQRDKSWVLIWTFRNAAHAAEETKVSASSISQCLKWKTKTWGWYIWTIK